MKETNTTDALNNELIVNAKYGYNIDSNGHCTVVIGEFLNFTKTGLATLKVISKKWFSGNSKEYVNYHIKENEKSSVKSMKLFPTN